MGLFELLSSSAWGSGGVRITFRKKNLMSSIALVHLIYTRKLFGSIRFSFSHVQEEHHKAASIEMSVCLYCVRTAE